MVTDFPPSRWTLEILTPWKLWVTWPGFPVGGSRYLGEWARRKTWITLESLLGRVCKSHLDKSWKPQKESLSVICTTKFDVLYIDYIYIYRTMFLKTGNAASVLGSGTWSICCGSKVKDLWWNRACRLVWWVRRMCSSCVTWTSRLRRFGRIYKYCMVHSVANPTIDPQFNQTWLVYGGDSLVGLLH